MAKQWGNYGFEVRFRMDDGSLLRGKNGRSQGGEDGQLEVAKLAIGEDLAILSHMPQVWDTKRLCYLYLRPSDGQENPQTLLTAGESKYSYDLC